MKTTWTKADPGSPWTLPRVPACYVITVGDGRMYVGSCLNLRKRFVQHKIRHTYFNTWITKWGTFNSLSLRFRPCRHYGEWLMVEARLIRRLRPALNIAGVYRKAAHA